MVMAGALAGGAGEEEGEEVVEEEEVEEREEVEEVEGEVLALVAGRPMVLILTLLDAPAPFLEEPGTPTGKEAFRVGYRGGA